MKPTDSSRWIILPVLGLILVIFLAGTLRTFAPARAALPAAAIPTLNQANTPLATRDSASPSPVTTPGPSGSPTLVPTPKPVVVHAPIELSADMTGIISLGILVVVVTLVGMIWGAASHRTKKPSK